jgi:hypothetical protein
MLVVMGQKLNYPNIIDVEGYRRTPSADTIREIIGLNADEIPVESAQKGDIFLMRLFSRKARHAAILLNDMTDIVKGIEPNIIHASAAGVRIQPLSDFPKEWFVAAFRVRGIVE